MHKYMLTDCSSDIETLETIGRRQIGNLHVRVVTFLRSRNNFHSFGSYPLVIDMLNSLVMAGVMLHQANFNILADMCHQDYFIWKQNIIATFSHVSTEEV